MGDHEAVLRREFDGEDGSFMLRLRCELVWDREAFSRLARAIEQYAEALEGEGTIPRWVAEGFWYASTFVPDWSGHPNFPRPEDAYHRRACERLRDLAYWLFRGEHPIAGGSFGPI